MHLTQDHTPMPNATAGLRPTGNFPRLVSEVRVCSLPEGGLEAAGVSEGTELEGLTNPSSVAKPGSHHPLGL